MDGTGQISSFDQTPCIPIFCFSHLRWASVFQRPQQLMSRFARMSEVWFIEEDVPTDEPVAALDVRRCADTGVRVVTPRLPAGCDRVSELTRMLAELCAEQAAGGAIAWYYTPMALPWSQALVWRAVIYDCMDELSAFRFAPPELTRLEAELLARADLVFTGGASLFESKRRQTPNAHCFPSGVDLAHFATARGEPAEPVDQADIAAPRLGYFGVIDERLDYDLLRDVAALRPDWQIVMVGPLAKVRQEELPAAGNIHWLGPKSYAELPAYLAHWQVALMPFALNEATRFISPTKAPEYLAGGKPVVSTPVRDVVTRFAGIDAVRLAGDAPAFVAAVEAAMPGLRPQDLEQLGPLLATMSWDGIHAVMQGLIQGVTCDDAVPLPATLVGSLAAPALHGQEAHFDYLVVGAGFAGSVMAERLAADAGARVLVVDQRPHIAGNAFDEADAAGLLVHRYGPHIFHTNAQEVIDYLSRFTAWRPYEHRVLASVRGMEVPMPINRTTLNMLYGLNLKDEAETAAFLASRAEPRAHIRTAEDFVIASVGSDLYRLFFQGYTTKQWGLDPSQLDKSVTARVPTRTSDDDRYFQDRFQQMPRDGYTRMFENMLDHRRIRLALGSPWEQVRDDVRFGHLIYTGPVDSYFEQRFGPLPYRSLRFQHETIDRDRVLPVATVNYPAADVPYTRVTEFKHLTGQQHPQTSVCYEFPTAEGDPYYPIPNPENQARFKLYEALADREPGVTFLGRLGSYRYFNMDQVVAQALATYRRMGVQRPAPVPGTSGAIATAALRAPE